MQWGSIYLAGTGACLPKTVSVEEAIADGRYDEESLRYTDHLSVTVAGDDDNIADMAVEAGCQAVLRAGYSPADVGAVFCSVAFHAGVDVWNSAAYVQQGVAGPGCFAVEVRAGSNGGLMTMEMAVAYLVARPEVEVAVATAGDLWYEPYFDRWRTDNMLYGDGVAAVALSRRGGFAKVLSLATTTDPSLEALHRGNEPWGPFRHSAQRPVDLRRRREEFLATRNRDEVWDRLRTGARIVADQALRESGVSIADIDHIVVPHFGRDLITRQCLEQLGTADLARTTWEFSRQVGHMGPGDQFAGLNHLTETGALKPGDLVFVYGVGAGFAWSAAVLQVLTDQPWAGTAR